MLKYQIFRNQIYLKFLRLKTFPESLRLWVLVFSIEFDRSRSLRHSARGYPDVCLPSLHVKCACPQFRRPPKRLRLLRWFASIWISHFHLLLSHKTAAFAQWLPRGCASEEFPYSFTLHVSIQNFGWAGTLKEISFGSLKIRNSRLFLIPKFFNPDCRVGQIRPPGKFWVILVF